MCIRTGAGPGTATGVIVAEGREVAFADWRLHLLTVDAVALHRYRS